MLKHSAALFLLYFSLWSLPSPLAYGQRTHQVGFGSASTVTWSLIQSLSLQACTTSTCSFTGVTTTAGDVLILASAYYNSTTLTFSSASGDSTWTHPTGTNSCVAVNGDFQTDCAYILSAAGGTGETISVTFSGTPTIFDLEFIEVRRSAGTASLDAAANTINGGAGCTSCTGPALTLSGASDYILQFVSDSHIPSSTPSSPWTNPAATDTTHTATSFYGALNQTTSPAFSWPFSSSTQIAAAAIAFK